MKTPIHKIELYVIELNNQYGVEEIKTVIENALDDYLVSYGKIETKDAGEWSDEHILNKTTTDVGKVFESLTPRE